MRAAEQTRHPPGDEGDWAEQTRRVLTRDLLLRAARAQPGERQALQFRALHLNLPLVGDAADRLSLTPRQRSTVEPDALDGLVHALRTYDPYEGTDFADYAAPFIEREIDDGLARLTPRLVTAPLTRSEERGHDGAARQRSLRLALRRVAWVIAGRL